MEITRKEYDAALASLAVDYEFLKGIIQKYQLYDYWPGDPWSAKSELPEDLFYAIEEGYEALKSMDVSNVPEWKSGDRACLPKILEFYVDQVVFQTYPYLPQAVQTRGKNEIFGKDYLLYSMQDVIGPQVDMHRVFETPVFEMV